MGYLGIALSEESGGGQTTFEPNLYLYDMYPGGVGQSAPLFRMAPRLLQQTAQLIAACGCEAGCPSCVGPVGEAGIANLVNAFIEAGADSVVSTLWELEDHSTSRMMTDFYHHVAMHEPEAEALRDAQLELIKDNAPPYYWASFQLVGNPDTTL